MGTKTIQYITTLTLLTFFHFSNMWEILKYEQELPNIVVLLWTMAEDPKLFEQVGCKWRGRKISKTWYRIVLIVYTNIVSL